jgi:hypothetical protein
MTTTFIPADSELASQVRPYLSSQSQASRTHWRWFRKATATLREFETCVREEWDTLSPADRRYFRMIATGLPRERAASFAEWLKRAGADAKVTVGLLVNREETLAYMATVNSVMDALRLRVAADVWKDSSTDADFERAAASGREEIAQGKSAVFFDPER